MDLALLLGDVNAANFIHVNLSGDSKWPLCECEWCVCVGPSCPGCLLDQDAIQVFLLSRFPILPAEFCQIRARRRLFVHFWVYTNVRKGENKGKYSAAD